MTSAPAASRNCASASPQTHRPQQTLIPFWKPPSVCLFVCEINPRTVKFHTVVSEFIALNITLQTYQIPLHDHIKTLGPSNKPFKLTKQHGLISALSGKLCVCIDARWLFEGFIVHFIFPITGLRWPWTWRRPRHGHKNRSRVRRAKWLEEGWAGELEERGEGVWCRCSFCNFFPSFLLFIHLKGQFTPKSTCSQGLKWDSAGGGTLKSSVAVQQGRILGWLDTNTS